MTNILPYVKSKSTKEQEQKQKPSSPSLSSQKPSAVSRRGQPEPTDGRFKPLAEINQSTVSSARAQDGPKWNAGDFCWSWSSYSINLLLFLSPRGPLARVIKRDVITRHGGPLQLQPPRNSPSIRQQSRQRVGEGGRKKKMAGERGKEMGDKREGEDMGERGGR